MQSSQDLLELGRTLAAARWPWQGWDSPEGGDRGGGSRRIPAPSWEVSEVRMEPSPGRVLGVLCSGARELVC